MTTIVVLPTMHLMQLSSHFRKEASRLMKNVPNANRAQRGKKATQAEAEPHNKDSTQGTLQNAQRAYQLVTKNSQSNSQSNSDPHQILQSL